MSFKTKIHIITTGEFNVFPCDFFSPYEIEEVRQVIESNIDDNKCTPLSAENGSVYIFPCQYLKTCLIQLSEI